MMEREQPLIELRAVSKVYALEKTTLTAVNGLTLNVWQGEFAVVTGRSGSGKTTLLNLIAGLTRPTSGQVLLEGVDLSQLGDREQSRLRNRKLGFVFQFPSLMPSLTVMENVLLPTMTAVGAAKPALRGRALSLLDEVGLADRLRSYPRQLSAGQQQRVVIARSLINQPELLLADEPTSNLDEHTEQEIMRLIQRLHAERGITVVMVTHSSELVRFGNRALRMAAGNLAPMPVEALGR